MARQERAVRTRRVVLEAAAEVFGECGYERAAILDILKRAGVTKGALYFHFPSKEALAHAVIEEQLGVAAEAQTGHGLQGAIDLTQEIAHGLQHDVMLRASIRLTLEATFDSPVPAPYHAWVGVIERLLAEAQERGEVMPQVEPNDTAMMIVGSFTGIQVMSEILTGRVDLSARITKFWQHVLPGIAFPGALAHMDPRGTGEYGAAAAEAAGADAEELPAAS
ncbi:ScbR family autoregulator-binding transcription factor [Streptomyces sp. NPDC041068]|uniref:ScbR family autoregulator-binding transcription factor n=1 Tax=Streptomyces sp. NPDC041068 TaxID=3155130 RepID=UPI0033E77935